MSYSYAAVRPTLFTEEGVKKLAKVRRNVERALHSAGAIRASEAWDGVLGDSWLMIACLDYLVEQGEIREVTSDPRIFSQHRVYVRGNR